ncbi:hypothetical protein AWB75_03476 [Caballeronia catudaia]|uniref:Uncharacterized protein n=1 Tax=Caballeronia catudaia TaxID=1777136 RepID=A0A158BGH8_9BURK|nr:hypothetical protein AWB75_03476 [Caballeronia catudaia]
MSERVLFSLHHSRRLCAMHSEIRGSFLPKCGDAFQTIIAIES